MRYISRILVFSLFACTAAWGEDPVHFADPQLQAVVEEELWITDPTPTDMLGLISLDASNRNITEMTGLEYATNLVSLRLPCNRIGGISSLSGLSHLRVVVLNNNEIGDLSPLAGLSDLEYLDFHDNHRISNLSPLAALSQLQTLILRGNLISDLSPLSGLHNLVTLDMSDNAISDASPLCSLTSLSSLDLRGNPLSIDSRNIYIPQIVANNPSAYIQPSASLLLVSISSTAGGSVLDPGEGDYTCRYGESIFLAAVADPGFVFVGWSGTYAFEQNPTLITVEGDLRLRAHFQSVPNILHVADNGADEPDAGKPAQEVLPEDGTAEHPFDRIQEALEVAGEGATIMVQPGTYRENIDFLSKNVRLIGREPNDPAPSDCPVIEGVGNGPAVRFSGSQRSSCLLTGFIITRGKGQPAGAIHCDGASPTIAHCLIVGNRSTDPNGAVIYCRDSRAILANCTVADNYGGANGAGLTLIDSDVTATNSILWDNGPAQILALGTSDPVIQYCDVQGWWPDYGNLKTDPGFAGQGSWVDPSDPERILSPDDSRAVWLDGDYHLQSQAGRWDPALYTWVPDAVTSPCIDSGERTTPIGHEPEPNGGRVNMGAYGGTSEASKSHLGSLSGQ
jgi:uncharacterized repeat protein (TIGR02543 family)